MKKSVIIIFSIGMLLVAPLILAQEQTYSGFDRFKDNLKLSFSGGENKVQVALEIRKKEVNSAIENTQNGNTDEAVENLEKAETKLQLVQEKVSLENAKEIKTSVKKIKDKIEEENLSEEFGNYILQEEKTYLTAELTLKTYEYCKELSKEDYGEMLKEEKCNPETAPDELKDELKELKEIQEELFVQLMLSIRSCIDDPGTCNCEEVLEVEEKAKCEKLVALAVKCEYKDDETSCSELEAMKPTPGDGFAKSFVPDFLMNLFSKKHGMIEYNLTPSDGVPEECWDENDKPECEQYQYLKETRLDWDKHGNFIGTRRARGIQEPVPTMEESIPQCFDENNNFLEEKCGKITIVRNKEGLVNYIIEKEVENISEEFENKSKQHTIDVNGTIGQTSTNEIKQEMNVIETQIAERTFAPGTKGIGEPGKDIKNIVIKGDEGSGDGGLKPEVKTEVSGGGGGSGNNNVVEGVDEGPGEPGVVDED